MDVESFVDTKSALTEFSAALAVPDSSIKLDEKVLENEKHFVDEMHVLFAREKSYYDEKNFSFRDEPLCQKDDGVALPRPLSTASGMLTGSVKLAYILLGVSFALALIAIAVVR